MKLNKITMMMIMIVFSISLVEASNKDIRIWFNITDYFQINGTSKLMSGSKLSCNDLLVDSGDACNPGGAGGGMVYTYVQNYSNYNQCSGSSAVIGIYQNGTYICNNVSAGAEVDPNYFSNPLSYYNSSTLPSSTETDPYYTGNSSSLVRNGDANKTLVYCGNITGATSNLCTLTGSGIESDPYWAGNYSLFTPTESLYSIFLNLTDQRYNETGYCFNLVSGIGNFSAWDKDYADLINTPNLALYNETNLISSLNQSKVNVGSENQTRLYCGNITGATSNLCTLTASGSETDPYWNGNVSLIATKVYADSLGNWTADKPSYSTLANTISIINASNGNWTQDKSQYTKKIADANQNMTVYNITNSYGVTYYFNGTCQIIKGLTSEMAIC